MDKVKLWLKAARVPFLQAAAVPAILGGLVAFSEGRQMFWGVFVLAILANMMVNAGTNLANDYWDHITGNDDINVDFTPFTGGSRTIQEEILPPRTMLRGAVVCFAIAFVAGMYLVLTRTWLLLPIGLFGLFFGYFYTAPPFKFGYRGVGEVMVGVVLGPLAVAGAYVVQSPATLGQLTWLWPSIPVGLLVALILYINEFPDYEADRAVGKNHLVVRLGRYRASFGYYIFIALIYLSILVPVALRMMPPISLVALLTLPIAVKAGLVVSKNYDSPQGIIPAQANTIMLHGAIGLLLSAAYVAQGLFFLPKGASAGSAK